MVFLFTCYFPLTGETSGLLNEYLNDEWATVNKTVYFVYNSRGDETYTIEEAVRLAGSDPLIARGLAPIDSSRAITVMELALLITRNFVIPETLTYKITRTPFFAARSLLHQGWVDGPPDRPLKPYEALEAIRQATLLHEGLHPLPDANSEEKSLTGTPKKPTPHFPYFDHGFGINTAHDFSFRTNGNDLYNTNNTMANYWLSLEINPYFGFLFDGGVLLSNPVDFENSTRSTTLYPLLSLAHFYFLNNGDVSWRSEVGIIEMGSPSSPVLSDPAFGLSFAIEGDSTLFSAEVGYTGGVTAESSTVEMSDSDVAAAGKSGISLYPYEPEISIHTFAPPRLLFHLFGEEMFPHGGLLGLSLLSQFDLRSQESYKELSVDEERFHSSYLTVSYDDSIVGNLYYAINATLSLNKAINKPSIYGSAMVSWYPTETTLISAEVTYSGGETGSFDAFIPMSKKYPGYVWSPATRNLFWSELHAIPFANDYLSIDLNGLVFFRSTTAEGIENEELSESAPPETLYLGSEANVVLTWRPFMDISFQLNGGVFIPNPSILSGDPLMKTGLSLTWNW